MICINHEVYSDWVFALEFLKFSISLLYNLLNPIIILDKKWYKQWKLYTKLHHMYVDAYKNVVPIINHIRRPSLEPKIGYFLCSFTRSWQIDQTCLYLQMHPSSQSEISWEIAARKLSFWQLVRALRELLFTPTQNNIKNSTGWPKLYEQNWK